MYKNPCKNAGSLLSETNITAEIAKPSKMMPPSGQKNYAGFLVVLKSCLNAIEVAVCTKEMPDSPEFDKPSSLAGVFTGSLL